MGLPEINISFLDNITNFPIHLHPAIVHFVISLPIIIFLIELVNLVLRQKAVNMINIGLLVLLFISLIGAYIAGVTDGKEAWDLLETNGQKALKAHKTFGTYIIIFGFTLVAIFKVISSVSKRMIFKILYLLILALFIVVILKQGKDGGELVNTYGVNVERANILDDKLFNLQSAYDDLNASLKESNTSKKKPLKDMNATTSPEPIAKKI
ncbi:MAG: hypothetical protein PHE73_08060 [Sulfurovaceae bacterium]|nr:hypothetical protein [Sulfurovaceae bacterium]